MNKNVTDNCCEHDHEHDHHHDDCCCGHDHEHHDHEHHHHHDGDCCCGEEHDHEHEHHHHDHDDCCCSEEHEHEHEHHHHHDGDCCCGHDHGDHDHEDHHEHKSLISKAKVMSHLTSEKEYIIEGLDCAHCAAKMEQRLNALPEIESASIIFATKQLNVTAKDPDSLLPQIESICKRIEGEVEIVEKASSVPSYKQDRSFWKDNRAELITVGIGTVLFIAGGICSLMDLGMPVILPVYIAAYLLLGWNVLFTSFRNIIKGEVFDENFLMSIATVAAFCIGDFAEGAGVMLFYRVGEFFEHIAVEKSRTQIMSAVDMRPESVNVVRNGRTVNIPADDAKVGDIIAIKPGERLPLDGVVVSGESRIDTSPVTGESVPIRAYAGREVLSGCINKQGPLQIEVTKPLSESMVTRILDSVENAAAGKPHIDKFITRFAKVYTPAVVIAALVTAVLPSIVTGNWAHWITIAITFLVISCPCALVISVPLAYFSGIGAASKLGILFKGGISIEALKKVKAIVMDKTGTLTVGNFEVQEVVSTGDLSEDELLSIAYSCEASSTHPIAESIVREAMNRDLTREEPSSLEEIAGMGIRAELKAGTVLCGNMPLMEKHGITAGNLPVSTATQIFLAVDGKIAGCITIEDTLKSDAVEAIANIKSKGLLSVMLTGDEKNSAQRIADRTGIDEFYHQLMPDEKLELLKDTREKTGPVMFVGDGINDAPVLAGADVGAAMGGGADAAIEAADVVFMNNSVGCISQSLAIAKATNSIAVQNVVFALAVKFAVIIIGLLGFPNIWLAVFADTGVAMICILNSLRILWKKYQ